MNSRHIHFYCKKLTQVEVGHGLLNVAKYVSCKSSIIIFLVYILDGSVMVAFVTSKVNTFVLLEMSYKINSIGSAKIPYFVHK